MVWFVKMSSVFSDLFVLQKLYLFSEQLNKKVHREYIQVHRK